MFSAQENNMKKTTYLTILSITAILVTGCGKKEVKVVVVEKQILNFPYELELIDLKGRKIEATLVGRSGEEIHFQKPNDSFIFKYPINELSNESKSIISSMPITEISIKAEIKNPKDSYVKFREDRIILLRKELKNLEYDLLLITGDSVARLGIMKEMKRVKIDIAIEEKQIEIYLFERDN
tara:strand:+ start:450 stop:992 length:543 start_codon:yes stop_codon:yes gene_type:complete